MDKNIIEYVGKHVYQLSYIKQYKRYLVFRLRCALHNDDVRGLLEFFSANGLREKILMSMPCLLEQLTRSFFYKASTWTERQNLISQHIACLEAKYKPAFLEKLYVQGERITVWEDTYNEKPLQMQLWFHPGQRKEGCLSLVLHYEAEELFQIMFWLNKDTQGKLALYVGALQGPRNGNEIIKGLTKAFFGYRPKNLIFYGLRNIAHCFGAEKIYAVCNEGYYAMNHLRMDRKLKTDFAKFWQECEGKQSADYRFYEIPVAEYRKAMEEMKPSKRAQHRRRFEKMDQVKEAISLTLANFTRK